MSTWIWAAVLLAAVFAAEWGSDHLAEPLRKLRKQWGLSAAAGGSVCTYVFSNSKLEQIFSNSQF
mgnify:CR=1 FL=1